MQETKRGRDLHRSYIDAKEPKLDEYKKILEKLKSKKNPDDETLHKIASYERVIAAIEANLYLVKEVYMKADVQNKYGI